MRSFPPSHASLTCFLLSVSIKLKIYIANLEKMVQELRDQLATSQRATNQEKDNLKEATDSVRVREESSSASIASDSDLRFIDIHVP